VRETCERYRVCVRETVSEIVCETERRKKREKGNGRDEYKR